MVHAFLLVLLLGDKPVRFEPMYFRSIDSCNYFAASVVKRYGNYNYSYIVPEEHRATAYCKPVYISEETETLYD
jgi:hypothetical protein